MSDGELVDEYSSSYRTIFGATAGVSVVVQLAALRMFQVRASQQTPVMQSRRPLFAYGVLTFGSLISTIGTGVSGVWSSAPCSVFAWTSSLGIGLILAALVERATLLFFWGREVNRTLLDMHIKKKSEFHLVYAKIANWTSWSMIVPAGFLACVCLILFNVGFPDASSASATFFMHQCQDNALKKLLLMQWIIAVFVTLYLSYRVYSSREDSESDDWPNLRREVLCCAIGIAVAGIYHIIYGAGAFNTFSRRILVTFVIFNIIFNALFSILLYGSVLTWDKSVVKPPKYFEDNKLDEKDEIAIHEIKKVDVVDTEGVVVVPHQVQEPEFPPAEVNSPPAVEEARPSEAQNPPSFLGSDESLVARRLTPSLDPPSMESNPAPPSYAETT